MPLPQGHSLLALELRPSSLGLSLLLHNNITNLTKLLTNSTQQQFEFFFNWNYRNWIGSDWVWSTPLKDNKLLNSVWIDRVERLFCSNHHFIQIILSILLNFFIHVNITRIRIEAGAPASIPVDFFWFHLIHHTHEVSGIVFRYMIVLTCFLLLWKAEPQAVVQDSLHCRVQTQH